MFKIGNRQVELWPVRGFDTVGTMGLAARYLSRKLYSSQNLVGPHG